MKRYLIAYDDAIVESDDGFKAAEAAAGKLDLPLGATFYVIDLDWLIAHAAAAGSGEPNGADPVHRVELGAVDLELDPKAHD